MASIFSSLLLFVIILWCDLVGAQWQLLHASIGISAMHMQLLNNDRVVIFDRTDFGPSNLSLPNGRRCIRRNDCTAHSVLFDVPTNAFRPLTLRTDVWCSSAALLPDGTLVQTGGYGSGDRAVRTVAPCRPDEAADPACDWFERPAYLARRRWYATNQVLPDGRVIIVGGRGQFNYEFYPTDRNTNANDRYHEFEFLRETRDDPEENNLYPFVHLLPDGTLFVFANTRCISLDYVHNRIVRRFPSIPGAAPRNYPSSGSSVLLPLRDQESGPVEAEVLVCGGAPRGSFSLARRSVFVAAVSTCGRLKVSGENSGREWAMERMPTGRVMGDMVIVPTGDVVIINGAGRGTAGWEKARDPITSPILYRTADPANRFLFMKGSPRPRLYHSAATLLPDARILVGGGNPHPYYNFTGVDYPTDLSLEAFSPPYLYLSGERPAIVDSLLGRVLVYGRGFSVSFSSGRFGDGGGNGSLEVALVAPGFATHSLGMSQRMVGLRVVGFRRVGYAYGEVDVVGPSRAEVAPPGYYMLFLVHGEMPSRGTWVKVGH